MKTACFSSYYLVLYQHFTSFDHLLQISAPRHVLLQDRAIQTSVQATRKGRAHHEGQQRIQWQKEAGTAQKDKKNGKAALPAAATFFPLLLYAAENTPKTAIKERPRTRTDGGASKNTMNTIKNTSENLKMDKARRI
jgi:hypothetical protein